MQTDSKRRSLGMGLSALFGESGAPAGIDGMKRLLVPVSALRPGRYQPRRQFDPESLAALAQSIREKGILQPLLVRPENEGADTYEIVAGERRWRAAQQAQLHDVPVIVMTLSDRDAAEISLIENLQRDDLGPIEEAEAYRRLMTEFHRTQEQVSETLGKSRSHVANTLRLLDASPKVQELLAAGKLSAGHARALIGIADSDRFADEIVARNLSVRRAEALVASKPRDKRPILSVDTSHAAQDLTMRWGLQVDIREHLNGGGALILRYRSLDELEAFIRRVK